MNRKPTPTKLPKKAALQKKNKLADIQTANIHARQIFAKLQTQDKLRQQLDNANAQQQLTMTQQQLTTRPQLESCNQEILLLVCIPMARPLPHLT